MSSTTKSYTMTTTLNRGYEDSVADTRKALTDVGFGVLTEIDIQTTLKNKLGVDVPAQIILGACRPPLAHRALEAEPSVAALLPCNVVVRDIGSGQTVVEVIDPEMMMSVTSAPALAEVAAEAKDRLQKALLALGGTAAQVTA